MTRVVVPLSLMIACLPAAVRAQASPQETLTHYTADLQRNPGDSALREKIIRHVQTMNPAPAIPEEARRFMARGAAAVKGAKTIADFQEAASEFEKAGLAAPWLPAAYYNLGIVQDKGGKYKEAIQSLELYLLAMPAAPDVEAVKSLIYEIEYRQEQAAKASSHHATAQQPNLFEDLLRKIDGRRYTSRLPENTIGVIDVRGRVLVHGSIFENGRYWEWEAGGRIEMQGRETTIHLTPSVKTGWAVARTYTFSEDGERVTMRARQSDGATFEYVYLWQR